MTKLEIAKLHDMQKSNLICEDSALKELWEIGDIAGIKHYCCYEYMLKEILASAEINNANKDRAMAIFRRHTYADGRINERRDTGLALGINWYE